MPPGKKGSFETARRILLDLPGVEEAPCYGTPGFRVRGKLLARLKEDGETLVVKCGFEERDILMQIDPGTFFTTAHYNGYPSVLVRLPMVDAVELRTLLETTWRKSAPKRLVARFDAARESQTPRRR